MLSGPLSTPYMKANNIDILHVGVMETEHTSITQFWDAEFTGTLPTTKFATTDDQQFLTAYLKSLVHHNKMGHTLLAPQNFYGFNGVLLTSPLL